MFDLVGALEADPLSFAERWRRAGRGPGQGAVHRPAHAAARGGWRNFYADQDFEVLLGVPSCSNDKTINIEYADLECYYARPAAASRNGPSWTGRRKARTARTSAGEDAARRPRREHVTELEERTWSWARRAGGRARSEVRSAPSRDYLLFTHCARRSSWRGLQRAGARCERRSRLLGELEPEGPRRERQLRRALPLLLASRFFDGRRERLVNLFHFRTGAEERSGAARGARLELGICVFPT